MASPFSRPSRVVFLGALAAVLVSCAPQGPASSIVVGKGASYLEKAAAREIRRYVYLRTGRLPDLQSVASAADIRRDAIVVVTRDSPLVDGLADDTTVARIAGLKPQEYALKTMRRGASMFLFVAGGDGVGTLYGAFQLAEKLGVRFFLEGDVVPDERTEKLSLDLDETGRPLFPVRGIQPFHDFPEGPDWWDRDAYKAILGQLPKLRMNFFGLHTYPEKGPNAEPTVWIGREGDADETGRVASAYPASYQNTLRGNWGYEAKKTGDFHAGAALLFERDDYGNDVMKDLAPEPRTPEGSIEVFDRAADVYGDAFAFAHKLGVQTCVGAETPLTIPELVKQRLRNARQDPADPETVKALYKGIFSRIARAYPIDYYWFWTWEGWTWDDASAAAIRSVTTDLNQALAAWREVAPPFRLATCGWVLGPPSERTLFDQVLPKDVAMSCINREVGKAPVDPGFARIEGRSRWAIPWLEDDPSLTSPQLWAGRMRRDAADALRYGCDGLLGIHWRTRILSPNVLALARAAWDQGWNTLPRSLEKESGPLTGQPVSFPDAKIAGTADPAVYQDVRDRVFAYYLPVPDGTYTVTLKFVEGQIDRPRGRVFDVLLQGKRVLDNLDIFARAGKFKALDFTFRGISVADGRLAIEFADRIHYPALAALAVEGPGFKKKINCGGPAVEDYEADAPATPRHLPALDFYRDWAAAQFGPGAAEEAGGLFASLDGRLPIPVVWTNGPGGIVPDVRIWDEVKGLYDFVERFEALRPKVAGAGALERFDYWAANFRYMREVARFNVLWARFNAAFEKVKTVKDEAERARLARETVLPLRIEMARTLRTVFDDLLASVSNPGELGTIANWEQHLLPGAWEKPGEELSGILGGPLPVEAELGREYAGPARVFVPVARTSREAGETLAFKVLILAKGEPEKAELRWRALGAGKFEAASLEKVARGVWRAVCPAEDSDLEYYVSVRVDGRDLVWPPAAPDLPQTVVVY